MFVCDALQSYHESQSGKKSGNKPALYWPLLEIIL